MIDRELVEKWLHDLRTTTVPQVRGNLRVDDGYCCLGRLIECVVDDPIWEFDVVGGPKAYVRDGDFSDRYYEKPTEEIERMVGLDRMLDTSLVRLTRFDEFVSVEVQSRDISTYLASLNDAGFSFKFIAAVAGYLIEEAIRKEGSGDE